MPKPYEFRNSEEIIKILKKGKSDFAKWFDRRLSSVMEIVYESVGTNTFRAFHHMPIPPSTVYRDWAAKQLGNKKTIDTIVTINNEQQYDAWIKNLSNSLRSYWENKMGQGNAIAYGPSRKLPNLLMKTFVLWEGLNDDMRTKFINFLHVPLDSFSLVGIRYCIREYPNIFCRSIPCNATMSFVTDNQMYNFIQQTIRDIAKKADVPPIYLDVLSWNRSH